jgi:hypothetical protein
MKIYIITLSKSNLCTLNVTLSTVHLKREYNAAEFKPIMMFKVDLLNALNCADLFTARSKAEGRYR